MNKEVLQKLKNPAKLIEIAVNAAAVLIMLFGAYISIKMNRGGHSLWFDEAALAENFTNRNLGNLISSVLVNGQSAPAGWLYLVKIIITILGNNEFNLRIASVLAYIGTMIVACLLGKLAFKSKYPLFYGAFVSMIGFFVKYSIVCKPYEFDALCVLLVILAFYFYSNKKINCIALSIIWAILIWFSNPACFFEGGLIIVTGVPALFKKDWKELVNQIVIGVVIVISFVANYLVWLRLAVGFMQNYWDGSEWPLIITSMQDLKVLKGCLTGIFGIFENGRYIIFALFILGIVLAIKNKEKLVLGIYVGFLVTMAASNVGFFPVADRLWCFAYPLIGITAIYTGEQLLKIIIKNDLICHIITCILLVIMLCTQTGWRYLYSFNLWWQHEEINAELDFLESVVTEDDNVYIYAQALMGYNYKYRDGEVMDVYKTSQRCDEVDGTVEEIQSLGDCYIVTNHYEYMDERDAFTDVINRLREVGFVQLVYYDHKTALLYYTCNEDNLKEEVNPEDYWY